MSKTSSGQEPNNAIVMAIQEPLSPIYKLHALACDDLFDYFSLIDLISIGRTCKRMHRLVGLYIQQNFRTLWLDVKPRKMKSNSIDITDYGKYIESITIRDGLLSEYRNVEAHCKSVKRLSIIGRKLLTRRMIDCFKHTLAIVEKVELHSFEDGDEIYESFLKFCVKIKSLSIKSTLDGIKCLSYKYPTLECLTLPFNSRKVDEIKTFLELNPNIKTLEIEADFLLENAESFMTVNATLNELIIECRVHDTLKKICQLLNDLYGRGFYKCIKLQMIGISQECADLLANLPGFEKFFFCVIDGRDISWPTLNNIKQIDVVDLLHYGFESLITSSAKLKRISLLKPTFEQLLFLMQRSQYLKVIKFSVFEEFLDIDALNKERAKQPGASQVILYLSEPVYLRTKWLFGDKEFKLIDYQREGCQTK